MTRETILIIGAGQAAAQTAASLRQGGCKDHIVIIGDEPALPYQRPPLSKAYLKGELEIERLHFKTADWYRDQNVTIRTSETVTSVNIEAGIAKTDKGETLSFQHLVFATGSRNRPLPMAGADLGNVFGLRSLEDVDHLRPHVAEGKDLVIIGAGYIGLETAAVARSLGANVTVLELADRVLSRVTSPIISKFYEELHSRHGVDIMTNTQAETIEGENGTVRQVMLNNGEVLPCDALLIGIGILPNMEVAQAAGVKCEDGILVDDNARTNFSNVYAAGDCAKRLIQPYNRMGRLESVHNAIEQGKQVASAILDKTAPKLDCPWFWSDQYSVKLQIAGLSQGYDEAVVRGSIADEKFAVFYFAEGILIAADAINSPPEFMTAKRLISTKAKVIPQDIANSDISLKDIMASFKAKS